LSNCIGCDWSNAGAAEDEEQELLDADKELAELENATGGIAKDNGATGTGAGATCLANSCWAVSPFLFVRVASSAILLDKILLIISA
jgi:hypothetical protein